VEDNKVGFRLSAVDEDAVMMGRSLPLCGHTGSRNQRLWEPCRQYRD